MQRRNVAMVYQQFINYPSLSVYENIASPLRVAGLRSAEIADRVRHAAKILRLEPYLDRRPLELSGGQQQRTAIARALVKRAELVLLDEPLANLDYKLREELREELPRIFAASGAIFVYATTEPAEALLLGGNTATLFKGRITQFGPTAQVYRRPDDLVTAKVFSDPPLNTIPAVKTGPTVTLDTGIGMRAAGAFATVPDGRYTVGFRAHHLALEPAVVGRDRASGGRLGRGNHRLGELRPCRHRRASVRGAGAWGTAAGAGLGRDDLSRSAAPVRLRRGGPPARRRTGPGRPEDGARWHGLPSTISRIPTAPIRAGHRTTP